MIDLIKSLFTSYGYTNTELDSSDLTLYSGSTKKEEYWLLARIDAETNVLKEQRDFFDKCAAHIESPSLEKNTSLLIVWETSGHLALETLKKKIMEIEEDAYFFKKYVLHYSPQQKNALLKELGDESLHNFLSQKLVSQETFQNYKHEKLDKVNTMTWQSLIYRMAIKMPFIDVDIKSKDDLGSLERENQETVEQEDAQIIELNRKLFSLEDKEALFDIDTAPEELLSALEGELNENTN